MSFKWNRERSNRIGLMVVFLFFFFYFLSLTSLALAAEPMEVMKGTIDEVIRILKDPTLREPGKKEERRVLLDKAIIVRFDFAEMAKRSLAVHWRERTPDEQMEFADLFGRLLESSYIGKIEAYTDEKVVYIGEIRDGDFAEVKTKVLIRQDEIPIDYRLLQRGSDWKVYDVVIDGVSLVNNYRNQFNKVIRNSSYEELVKKMKAKEAEISVAP